MGVGFGWGGWWGCWGLEEDRGGRSKKQKEARTLLDRDATEKKRESIKGFYGVGFAGVSFKVGGGWGEIKI